MTFKEYLGSLSDEYLKIAFEETEEFHNTGILSGKNIREIRSKWKKIFENDIDVAHICDYVNYEIARRWYNEKWNNKIYDGGR